MPRIVISGDNDSHSELMQYAMDLEYPGLSASSQIIPGQIDDAIMYAEGNPDVVAIIRSTVGLSWDIGKIAYLDERFGVFYPLGSNEIGVEITSPSFLYPRVIVSGAGDEELQNNTAYGDGLCFWDWDTVFDTAPDASSFSNARILGKMLKVKDEVGCSWWEANWRCRVTADRVEPNRPSNTFWHKLNGFGRINTDAAIAYTGDIYPEEYSNIRSDTTLGACILSGEKSKDKAVLTFAQISFAEEFEVYCNDILIDTIPSSTLSKEYLLTNKRSSFRYRAKNQYIYSELSNEVLITRGIVFSLGVINAGAIYEPMVQ